MYINDIQIRQREILHKRGSNRSNGVMSATDANSEKKWRGFYNSLSQTELQDEWDEYWRT